MYINNYHNLHYTTPPHFKSSYNNDDVIGIDSATEDVRNYLRKHYEEKILPYSYMYETAPPPSTTEYMFIHYPKHQISQPIKLEGFKNSYRGLSLCDNPKVLEELRNKGIKTIIDLGRYGDGYQTEVEDAGMNYFNYDIQNFSDTSLSSNEQYDSFADIISAMKQDNFHIACILGTKVTNYFLDVADYFINPNRVREVSPNIAILATVEDALNGMTSEQKEKMGLTPDDEKAILKRIDKEYLNY